MMKRTKLLRILGLVWGMLQIVSTKNTYNMDVAEDCNFAGILDVPSAESKEIYVNAKSTFAATSSVMVCSLNFRSTSENAGIQIDFDTNFFIRDCDVHLYIFGDDQFRPDSLDCQSNKPNTIHITGRSASIRLDRRNNDDLDYSFQLIVRPYDKSIPLVVDDHNPIAVGLVIGIVGGIMGFLIVMIICGVCCYKVHKRHRDEQFGDYDEAQDMDTKVWLDDREPSNASLGITNNSSEQSGTQSDSSPRMKKKLLESENHVGSRSAGKPPNRHAVSGRPQNLNLYNENEEQYDELQESEGKEVTEQPKSPILNALHSNAKFRATFQSTEADAEERAKRISSSSLPGTIPTTPPALPAVPSVQKSPASKRNHAGIRRAPRPTSNSSEELEQLGKPPEDTDDVNIRIIRENEEPASPTEIVPIKVNDPHNMDSSKNNTLHTLKPQRGRSPQERRKQQASVAKQDEKQKQQDSVSKQEQNPKQFKSHLGSVSQQNGAFQKEGSYRGKKSSKSPRLGSRSAKNSTSSIGFSHRNRAGDRPETPTSMYDPDDDLESLPPLQRTASRQSLYASRSSLYGRRGHRRRDSYGESVSSYAHDDMELYRHSREYDHDDDFDGYEKPISRRERERMFKSVGDIDRNTRATQTLRETATQTGQEEGFVLQPKRIVNRKSKPRSQSVATTQTREKREPPSEPKTKPKTKPKPRPRKAQSVSAALHLDEREPGMKVSKSDQALDARDEEKPKMKISKSEQFLDSHDATNPKTVERSLKLMTTEQQMPTTTDSQAYQPQMTAMQAGPEHASYYPANQINGPFPPQQQMGMYPGQPNAQHGLPPRGWAPQTVPIQGRGFQPVHPQGAIVGAPQPVAIHPALTGPRPPRKSNWDMLCDLTEADNQNRSRGVTETGSVTSSVFTNNPPSYPGDQHPVYPPPGSQVYNPVVSQPFQPVSMHPYQPVPSQPYQPVPSQPYQPVSVSSQPYNPPINMQQFPSAQDTASIPQPQYAPPAEHKASSLPDSNSPVPVASGEAIMYPRQSSWEVLKQLTDSQYRIAYGSQSPSKSESFV